MSFSETMSDDVRSLATDLVRRSPGRWNQTDLAELTRANFSISVAGFDRDEVRSTLRSLAADFQALRLENVSLQKQIAGVEKTLSDYRREEQTFRSAIVTLQRQYDDARKRTEQSAQELQEAKAEAGLVLQRARADADEILAQARARAQKLERYVQLLRQHQGQFYAMVGRTVSDLHAMKAGRPPVAVDEVPAAPPSDGGHDDAPLVQAPDQVQAVQPQPIVVPQLAAVEAQRAPAEPRADRATRVDPNRVVTVDQIDAMLKGIDHVLVDIPTLPA